MGNNTSKVSKLRRKKSRQKAPSNDSSFSSKNSFSEETSFDSAEILPEDPNYDYNTVFVNLWGMEYSAPVDDILMTAGKILEAGCGYGSWLISMSQKFPTPEYSGIDLAPVNNVNYPPNVKVVKGDLFSLPYDENQFDFARMSSFSAFFTDNEWMQGISEMIRVTKCGGWIEIWEPEALHSADAPTYSKFIEAYQGSLTLNGITGVNPAKLEYFLYSTRKLDNIQSSIKSLVIGQKGGEEGINFLKSLNQWFRDSQNENLSSCMDISQEEYKRKWTIALDEIEKNRVEIIFYRLWAQKKTYYDQNF